MTPTHPNVFGAVRTVPTWDIPGLLGKNVYVCVLADKHSIAISAMGNYQEFLSTRVPPLREIDPTPPRQHAFGNPYKLAGADREKVS